jgi:hypothetical protein
MTAGATAPRARRSLVGSLDSLSWRREHPTMNRGRTSGSPYRAARGVPLMRWIVRPRFRPRMAHWQLCPPDSPRKLQHERRRRDAVPIVPARVIASRILNLSAGAPLYVLGGFTDAADETR